MTIPDDWLMGEVDLAEVEANLAFRGAPSGWLRGWRGMVDRMELGDALWSYWDVEYGAGSPAPTADLPPGFEPVADVEFLERIGLVDRWERESQGREGYAVVRDGAIVDWIETPF